MILVNGIEFKYGKGSKLKVDSSKSGDSGGSFEYQYVKQFKLKVESLELKDGESLAITGVSGSGKSTFLKLLSGELPVQTGSISILGKNLHEMKENSRRGFRLKNLGMIFQDSPLLEYLSAYDNILLPVKFSGHKSQFNVEDLALNCGIENLLDRYPARLSEGEKQRVAICRALISSPKIVLADEPISSLDPARGEEITDLLINNCQKQKSSLVMVTHNHSLLDKFDKNIDISELGESHG